MVGEVSNVDLMRPEDRLPMAYCRGKMGNFTEVYELLNASKGHDLSGNSGQEPGVIPVKR